MGKKKHFSFSLDLEAANNHTPRRSDLRYLWNSDRRNFCTLADTIIQITLYKKKGSEVTMWVLKDT